MAQRLTAHFNSAEFDCHDGTPTPAHAYDDLRRLCRDFLEPLRHRFGPVIIVSGYRHAAYNRQVGGAPDSFHIYRESRAGAAADVQARNGGPAQWTSYLNALHANGLHGYSDHVHVDNRAGSARW
jgi:uncharacterized protein YcbK (DUF882 family)